MTRWCNYCLRHRPKDTVKVLRTPGLNATRGLCALCEARRALPQVEKDAISKSQRAAVQAVRSQARKEQQEQKLKGFKP